MAELNIDKKERFNKYKDTFLILDRVIEKEIKLDYAEDKQH